MTDIMRQALGRHPLFAAMRPEEADLALQILQAKSGHYGRGDFLIRQGEPIRRFGIVCSGMVQVCVDDIEGNRMIMAEVTPGVSFAESLCFLRTEESPVYCFASEESQVLWLSVETLFAGGGDAFRLDLQRRFTAALAVKNLAMNNRIQVLSRLGLRAKLTAYFTELAAAQGSQVIRLPMNRDDTAAYIGANRSALSRELGRMKAEGLIEYHRDQVTIL